MFYGGWTRAGYVLLVVVFLAALLKPERLGVAETQKLVSHSLAGKDAVVSESPAADKADPPARRTPTYQTSTEDPPPESGGGGRRNSMSLEERRDSQAGPAVARPGVERVRRDHGSASSREPLVFYRPSLERPEGMGGDSSGSRMPELSGPACGDLGDFPRSSRAVFPLPDTYLTSYDDTWGAPRPQGGHEGTDLMSASGTPEYAMTDGTIVPVSGANKDGWNTLGGYTVMLRADYDIGPIRKGDLFYYAHMKKESALEVGDRVRAGQILGYAGDTGQGPEVTRGLFPSHLHFGWYDASGARANLASGAMNPYPLLEWIKANGGTVVGGSEATYCEAPQPRAPVPSTGGKHWPHSHSPGAMPDLDTGTEKAYPSPVAEKNSHSRSRASHGKSVRDDRKAERNSRTEKPVKKTRDRTETSEKRKTEDSARPKRDSRSDPAERGEARDGRADTDDRRSRDEAERESPKDPDKAGHPEPSNPRDENDTGGQKDSPEQRDPEDPGEGHEEQPGEEDTAPEPECEAPGAEETCNPEEQPPVPKPDIPDEPGGKTPPPGSDDGEATEPETPAVPEEESTDDSGTPAPEPEESTAPEDMSSEAETTASGAASPEAVPGDAATEE